MDRWTGGPVKGERRKAKGERRKAKGERRKAKGEGRRAKGEGQRTAGGQIGLPLFAFPVHRSTRLPVHASTLF